MRPSGTLLALAIAASASPAIGAAAPYTVTAEVIWRAPLVEAGKNSPRGADLNGDGIDDVVIGCGVEDHWGEALALDGRDGSILWKRRFPEEVLTASPFLDIDGDRIRDVLVAGRTRMRDVFALSGKDGAKIWSLAGANPQMQILPINFVSLVLAEDRDRDGLEDLLVVQAGGRDSLRLAARLHWVRSKDGTVLTTVVTPDGKESYSLPLLDRREGRQDRLYVGTGGETLGGNLFQLRLPAGSSSWRVPSLAGGFIGSPLLVDLEDDGAAEILATSMSGSVYRVDADAGQVAWRWRERPLWTYVSPAPGAFDEDPALDVVAGFNRGSWPQSEAAVLVWLDGRSGHEISRKEFHDVEHFVAGSPLVLDVNHDGLDETMIVLSDSVLDPTKTETSHALLLLDGGSERGEALRFEGTGYSLATPRIGDLDADGKLDVVYTSRDAAVRLELTVQGSAPARLPAVRLGELHGPEGRGLELADH